MVRDAPVGALAIAMTGGTERGVVRMRPFGEPADILGRSKTHRGSAAIQFRSVLNVLD
jgi:hypothetical protein